MLTGAQFSTDRSVLSEHGSVHGCDTSTCTPSATEKETDIGAVVKPKQESGAAEDREVRYKRTNTVMPGVDQERAQRDVSVRLWRRLGGFRMRRRHGKVEWV